MRKHASDTGYTCPACGYHGDAMDEPDEMLPSRCPHCGVQGYTMWDDDPDLAGYLTDPSLRDSVQKALRRQQAGDEEDSGPEPLTTSDTDAGEVHILPSERSGNGRHQVMVIDANSNSQWPTQYEPGRYGWDNPEAVVTPTHILDQAHEFARALDRTRGTKDAPMPNATPQPNQYGFIPFHVPGNELNSPEHPDPWMDNEPGTLTLPEHWGSRRL